MAEREENLISTGIDRLMQYMQSQGEAEVDEAADFLGVDTDTVTRWAKALEESGLVEVRYTATRGRVITRTTADGEEAEEQIEEAKEEASQKIDDARMESERSRIEQFETVLERLEEVLETDEAEAEELRGGAAGEDLRKIEAYLSDIDATEEDVQALRDDLEDILADMGVIAALRKHRAEASAAGTRRTELLEVEADREYTCDACGEAFYTRIGLQVHQELFDHGDRTYTCTDCEKTFDTERGLHIHEGMKGHGTDPRGVADRVRALLGMETGSFKCAECASTFEDAEGLQAHQHGTGHRVHKLRCDRCRRTFETVGALHAHEAVNHHG